MSDLLPRNVCVRLARRASQAFDLRVSIREHRVYVIRFLPASDWSVTSPTQFGVNADLYSCRVIPRTRAIGDYKNATRSEDAFAFCP